MAKLPGGFSSKGVEEMSDFSVLPAGEYVFKIVKSDYRANKNENGHFAELEMECTFPGKYKGRKLWRYLNLDNPSEKAVEIAQKEFAAICRAVGKISVEDTAELHGIPFNAKLSIQKGKGDNPDRNNVSKYWGINESGGEGSGNKPPKPAADDGEQGEAEPAPVKRKKPLFEDDDD